MEPSQQIEADRIKHFTLKESLKHMLNKGENSDVTIKLQQQADQSTQVDDVTKSNDVIRAHMNILRCRCPSLAAAAVADPEATGQESQRFVIDLMDVTSVPVRKVLSYIYFEDDDMTTLSIVDLFGILNLTTKYDIPILQRKCVSYIKRKIDVKTVCEILKQGMIAADNPLIEACAEFIGRRTKEVLESDGFNKSDVTVVDKIASLDTISVREVDLFKSCVSWAKTDQSDDVEGVRTALSTLLDNKRFRFPTMTIEEFNEVVVPTKILNPDDTVEIYNYLVSRAQKKRQSGNFGYSDVPRYRPIQNFNSSTQLGWATSTRTRTMTPPSMTSQVYRDVFFSW